jgi:enoyl-[acyl-carrier protein] reductase I
MAFTYQDEAFGKRLRPLAESIGAKSVMQCDASKEADLDRIFETLKKRLGFDRLPGSFPGFFEQG